MEIYYNPYPLEHAYLTIEDDIRQLTPNDFDRVQAKFQKPLQVMPDSTRKVLIELLKQSGFVLKRRCYEMEVSSQQF